VPSVRSSTFDVKTNRWTGSCGGFDRLPGVVILELRGAQVAERRVQSASVVDLVDEAGKIGRRRSQSVQPWSADRTSASSS
jgi:hypothetical protein